MAKRRHQSSLLYYCVHEHQQAAGPIKDDGTEAWVMPRLYARRSAIQLLIAAIERAAAALNTQTMSPSVRRSLSTGSQIKSNVDATVTRSR
mmetsp:Transcript_25563/g.52040  ORF Transcript_25563/g.52040 Transcript_25563/m.52040 type:complete len:91 (-) Transcript_25563:1243-1515(-)